MQMPHYPFRPEANFCGVSSAIDFIHTLRQSEVNMTTPLNIIRHRYSNLKFHFLHLPLDLKEHIKKLQSLVLNLEKTLIKSN